MDTTLELVEQTFGIAGGPAWTGVVDRDVHGVTLVACGHGDQRPGRCVLRRVVEQVCEYLHDQRCIDEHERQIRRQRDLDVVLAKPLLRLLDSRPDEILEALPVAAQYDLTRIEAHEVEHLRDELRHVARFRLDRARKVRALRIVERGAARNERRRSTGHRRERRTKIVRDRREQRITQRLALGRNTRAGGRLRKPSALERQADLGGKRLEQMALLREQDAPRVLRQDGKHAETAPAFAERQVQGRRGRQRVGPQACAVAVIGYPLGDGEVRAAVRPFHRYVRGVTQPACRVRQEHDALALKNFRDVLDREARHAVAITRSGELPAHRIEQRRAAFAGTCNARLRSHARHQRRDHERDRQHDREREQVLNVRNGERITRRHEKEIEAHDVQHGRQHGR